MILYFSPWLASVWVLRIQYISTNFILLSVGKVFSGLNKARLVKLNSMLQKEITDNKHDKSSHTAWEGLLVFYILKHHFLVFLVVCCFKGQIYLLGFLFVSFQVLCFTSTFCFTWMRKSCSYPEWAVFSSIAEYLSQIVDFFR